MPNSDSKRSGSADSKADIELQQFHVSPLRMVNDVQNKVVGYLDAKALANALGCKFFSSVINMEPHWKRLVIREISDVPKLNPNESYKAYYRRAHHLWSQCEKTLANPRRSQQQQYQLHVLFARIIENGYEKYARVLIKHVNVNAEVELMHGDVNRTFLHRAAKGQPVIVALLLEHKAVLDPQGDAFTRAGAKFIKRLKKHGDTPLQVAADHGDEKSVKLLADAKADVNYQNMDTDSALHKAARKGHDKCVAVLLAADASVDCKDYYGKLPIQVAEVGSACFELIKAKMVALHVPVPEPQKPDCTIM